MQQQPSYFESQWMPYKGYYYNVAGFTPDKYHYYIKKCRNQEEEPIKSDREFEQIIYANVGARSAIDTISAIVTPESQDS